MRVDPPTRLTESLTKATKASAPKTPAADTRRPITTEDINGIFDHMSDKVKGTFDRCKGRFRWASHPDRKMWKSQLRRESTRTTRKDNPKTEEIRNYSGFMDRLHGSNWGEQQKWDVPKGRGVAQGGRYLDVDVRAGLNDFDIAVSNLQDFIVSQDEQDTDAWRDFGSLKIEERYKLDSVWSSALTTTSLLRVRKMLQVLRESCDSTKQLPGDLEDRIWWCVFLAALPLVYQG